MAYSMIQNPRHSLALMMSMITCLIVLISISFKIIDFGGLVFTAGSVVCTLIACIYLLILQNCTLIEQRHILNQALLALYLFSIGIFLLLNLPAADYMQENTAYQIVFEDIPRKFFAATLSFALSFYIPHMFFSVRMKRVLHTSNGRYLLAAIGGLCFFGLNFFLLFADLEIENLPIIFGNSALIASLLMLFAGGIYLTAMLIYRRRKTSNTYPSTYITIPCYHYLLSFAITVLLICLACEYRLLDFGHEWIVIASGVFFPFVLMSSNLVGELYGWKANLRFGLLLVLAQLVFESVLSLAILLPSPGYFDLNSYYAFIMPQRILASTLGLLGSLLSNIFLLEGLRRTRAGEYRVIRILITNLLVTTFLCLVNYNLLFSGIYPYGQIFDLVINGWIYKLLVTVLSLPLLLWVFRQMLNQYSIPSLPYRHPERREGSPSH